MKNIQFTVRKHFIIVPLYSKESSNYSVVHPANQGDVVHRVPIIYHCQSKGLEPLECPH